MRAQDKAMHRLAEIRNDAAKVNVFAASKLFGELQT